MAYRKKTSRNCLFPALLMPFRDVSVLLLALAMPLAASGSFTGATSGYCSCGRFSPGSWR